MVAMDMCCTHVDANGNPHIPTGSSIPDDDFTEMDLLREPLEDINEFKNIKNPRI